MEIFLHGVWGTINYVGTDSNDATVVCRQLGYHTYSKCVELWTAVIGLVAFAVSK